MLSTWRLRATAVLLLAVVRTAGAAGDLPPGVTLEQESDGSLVVWVAPPEPVPVADPLRGTRLVIPGWGPGEDGAWPWLPAARVRLAWEGAGPATARVEVLEVRRLDLAPEARPLQARRVTDPEDPAGPGEISWSAGAPRPLPRRPAARLESGGRLRGEGFVTLTLSPIRPAADRSGIDFLARYRVVLPPPRPGRPRAPRGAASGAGGEEIFRDLSRRFLARPGDGGEAAAPGQTTDAPAAAPLASESLEAASLTQEAVNAAPQLRPAVPVAPDAGSEVYRLAVSADGIVTLDGAWLAAHAPDLMGRPAERLFLAAGGVELPVRLEEDGDGLISAGDRVHFYGEKVDEDPLDPDAWESGDYTDTRPYYLGVAAGPGLRMSTAVGGAPVSGHPLLVRFTDTVRVEEDDIFLNTLPDDAATRWYDQPLLLQTSPSRVVTVPTPGADPAGTATIRARMLGQLISGNLEGYHRTRLQVNGLAVDTADWDGITVFTQGADGAGEVSFAASQLTAATDVSVDLTLDRQVDGVTYVKDLVALDWVEISYPRLFVAEGGRLQMTVPGGDARILVSGLPDPAVAVYEIVPGAGGLAAPRHLADAVVSGSGPYSVEFELKAADGQGLPRTFAVQAGAGDTLAGAVPHVPGDDLAGGGADWLLIGADSLLDTGPGSQLSALAALRQSQGLQTRVVGARAVYDQFSYGLEDPQAIRDLVAWALQSWNPAPTYVVLVGDATYDYKNSYGNAASRNILPTFMASQVGSPQLTYYSMDNRFAAVLGSDDLPDALLGRLPAADLAEAEALFGKLTAYESLAPGAAWTRRGFFMSDAEGGNFELTLRQPIDRHFDRPENPGLPDPDGPCLSTGTCRNDPAGPGPLFATASLQALIDRSPGTPLTTLGEEMRTWIRDGLDAGAVVSHFNGHGGFQGWGRDVGIWETRSDDPDDVDSLSNGSAPTFLLNVNCITGGFHADSSPAASNDLRLTLGEDFLRTPGRGAVGVLAPSHLTFISLLGTASSAFWGSLMGESRTRRLGGVNAALRLAFDQVGATTDLKSFAFLGDPATVLAMPDPAAPGVPVPVAGNGQVSLSWTAGPDAVTFRLERSSGGPAGSYVAVTPPGHAATGFVDSAVLNGTTYHYRLRGFDGDGMPTVLANDNGDCPAGPGCVVATPLNPDPPTMPSGFDASDPGIGSELDLSWAAPPETDIDHWVVRYGTDPGSLDQAAQFQGGKLAGTLAGLEPSVPVHMTLEAVNTSGLTGPATDPISATPRFVLGLRPPRAVDDLRLVREGDDVVLSWSQVAEDIYGDPRAVASYRVHATGASPVLVPGPGNMLATVSDGPAPESRHSGGALGPGFTWYLVIVEDEAGQPSAAGTGPPAPITGLEVFPGGVGELLLSWPPVTGDVDGIPVVVDHYEVYAAETPFSRADIEGMVPIRTVTETGVSLLESEGSYFSVLAVTARGDRSPY